MNEEERKGWWAHESSVIDEGSIIGERTKIWHFSHVCSGALVGANCVLGQNVYVAENSIIGSNCKIQNNVSLYSGVELENGVFIGPSVVFTNVINPRAHLNRRDEFRVTRVCEGASIGANATIICGIEIGKFAFIGAGATVTRAVKPYSLVTGVPARQVGWVSKCGVKLNLPVTGEGETQCPESGRYYILRDSDLNEKY